MDSSLGYTQDELPNRVPPSSTSALGDSVMTQAKKRWRWCSEWESPFRPRFIEDVKFSNGDSDNGYQWPNEIRQNRDTDQKPCLTMNLIRQHNLNISNEARKNKSSAKVFGTGNGATEESATAMRDCIRHIEMISKAQDCYTKARGWQIDGGIGWWRVVTDYAGPETFDQEIYIRPINDPLSVYMDPDIQQQDGSDARFAFVFDNVPRDEFDESYPRLKGQLQGQSPMGVGTGDYDWNSRDFIRVCEYFRKVRKPDQLVSFMDGQTRKTLLASKMPQEVFEALLKDHKTKVRYAPQEKIEWYLIVGEQIVDETEWVGKYIPLVRIIGEETVIEGLLDRKGHTRNMKDAQRMFNYNASAQVEFVALQGKTPWVATSAAIEQYEVLWNTANVQNHSVLVYNGIDDEGNPIPPPQRTEPPNAAPGYQSGMDTAFNQIMMVSGQYQNQMGMQGNERTGAAIDARQAQSATSVFHFQDNYEIGLRFTATILIDLIPKVYDTRRVLNILADDGASYEMEIDPNAQQAFAKKQASNGEIVKRIFNPTIGLYDVAPGFGPAYETKRQESRDSLALILTQSKELTPIIGDLLLSSMDFDDAQEAAQRLKRMVPPQALGNGPTQNEQALQGQIQNLTAALTESLQRQGKVELKLVGKEQLRDIDTYKAETDRLGVLGEYLASDPEGVKALIRDIINDALRTDLGPIIEANSNNLDIDGARSQQRDADDLSSGAATGSGEVMPRGARLAKDGKYYIEDPTRQGKYLQVDRRG